MGACGLWQRLNAGHVNNAEWLPGINSRVDNAEWLPGDNSRVDEYIQFIRNPCGGVWGHVKRSNWRYSR